MPSPPASGKRWGVTTWAMTRNPTATKRQNHIICQRISPILCVRPAPKHCPMKTSPMPTMAMAPKIKILQIAPAVTAAFRESIEWLASMIRSTKSMTLTETSDIMFWIESLSNELMGPSSGTFSTIPRLQCYKICANQHDRKLFGNTPPIYHFCLFGMANLSPFLRKGSRK